MRLSEPHILFTDGFLTVQATLFAILLSRRIRSQKNRKTQLMWIGYYISIAIFALNGTIKHFTTNDIVYNVTRKVDVTAGCAGIFWIQIAIPCTIILQKIKKPFWFWINATVSFLIVNILLIASDWDFIVFGYYLFFVIFEFIIFGLSISYKNVPSNELLAREIVIFFGIAFLLGMIFLIGRHKWLINYGSENQYVLNIGNEIFHVGIMYPNFRLFKTISQVKPSDIIIEL